MKITSIDSLEQYELLLMEKSENRKFSLRQNLGLFQQSINPIYIFSEGVKSTFPILGKKDLQIYSAIEFVNWGYKFITKNKETPTFIRFIRLYLPKFLNTTNSI